MSDHDNHDSYPRVVASHSLYMNDPSINKDAEYHMQCVEIEKNRFQVNYQHGRRGAKLTHGTLNKGLVMSRGGASEAMNDHIASKRAKGYKPILLDQLHSMYEDLINGGLDTVGTDIFMERDRKTISMLEYIHNAGDAARDSILAAGAYAAKAKMSSVLKKIGRLKPIDAVEYRACFEAASRKLRQSGLDQFGVFIGYTDVLGTIQRGIPPLAPVATAANDDTQSEPRTTPKTRRP